MSTKAHQEAKQKHTWNEYLTALGHAHRKASVELQESMPLLQHLNELRSRMFKAFAALIVSTAFSFAFAQKMIDFLASPIGGAKALVSIEITENLAIFMKVSLLSGVVFSMPVFIYQALRFIFPGLKANERLWVLILVPIASLLFLSGIAFTWFVMLPRAVPFLTGFMGIPTQVRPANYFDFITRLMFWIGVCFEMPLLIMFLVRFNFTTVRKLASGWRYAIVGMAIIAAFITPTVDPINMGLVLLPLLGLYLISLLLGLIVQKG